MTSATLEHEHEPFLWSRILVRGAQSETFLQGQLSQDLSNVREVGINALLLEPNSDVLATCALSRVSNGFDVVIARDAGEAALKRLGRFHLRVDCTLTLEHVLSGPFNTLGEQVDHFEPGPAEFLGFSPQCYGTSLVERTVSFTKGCFTGQELVARLDARVSRVPWRFVHAVGPSLEAIETVLRAKGPDGSKGVTTAVAREKRVHALGFIHRSALGDTVLDDVDVKVVLIT
jgi:folate-binding Fe-S cluster repair protein YgfZ